MLQKKKFISKNGTYYLNCGEPVYDQECDMWNKSLFRSSFNPLIPFLDQSIIP